MQRSKRRKIKREQKALVSTTESHVASEKTLKEVELSVFPLALSLGALLCSCVFFAVMKANYQFVGMGWIYFAGWFLWGVLLFGGIAGWIYFRKRFKRSKWRWYYAPILIVLGISFSVLTIQQMYSYGLKKTFNETSEKNPHMNMVLHTERNNIDSQTCSLADKERDKILDQMIKRERPPVSSEFSFVLDYTTVSYQKGCDKHSWKKLYDFAQASDKKWTGNPIQNRLNSIIRRQWPSPTIGCIYESARAGSQGQTPNACQETGDRFWIPK